MKGTDMELFKLEVSQYGISLTTYFGDLYVFWRTAYLAIGVVAILLIAKRIRKAVK